MAGDYTQLPRDDHKSASGNPTSLDKVQTWWKSLTKSNESAPLLDRDRMTLGPSKKSPIKVFCLILGVIITAIVIGVGVVYWLDEVDPEPVEHVLTATERHFLDLPSNDSIREYLKIYTSEAHLAGTESDKRQAEWTKEKLIELGIKDTKIEEYHVLLNYPIQQRLELISGPEEFRYKAKLREDIVDEDETSKRPDAVPPFHGYSKNGSVTGPVVYANYGSMEDFQFLVDQGIHLNGTIALVRYGNTMRGVQVHAAELFGCIGALIYSDPIDDGPLNKEGYPYTSPPKAYPEGPWRPASSVQRGSVGRLEMLAGDPTTPGWPSTKDAPRVSVEDSPGFNHIPSLPLSYGDALPLLKATQGRGVRGVNDWAGGLTEVDYFSGPTEGDVELVNNVDYKITPIWDVIGVIKGTEEPDKAVILGNHRDAWGFGAVDPSSGSAAMLELASAFGKLLETGWKPARTILLASWDAEEYGLIGSVEWVEDHREWLSKEGLAYINVDIAVSGPHLTIEASPSLNQLIYEVTSNVVDQRTNRTVYNNWAEHTNRTIAPSSKPHIGQLGSGSDFVGFLDHLGIASITMEFDGDYGVYHSNYDSFHWMEKFGDPGFHTHQTMVKIWGLMALRMADSPIIPMHPGDYANALGEYVTQLSVASQNETTFPTLSKAIHKLSKAAKKFERSLARLEFKIQEYERISDLPSGLAKHVSKANNRMTFFERGFLDPEGITERTWFKHIVFAPGVWTGYASQVFPAISDALATGDSALVKHTEQRAALSINNVRKSLKS